MPSIPLIIDTSFAENVSANGNRCGITFSPPVQIPRTVEPKLRLYSASLAYNLANISSQLGNDTLIIDRMSGGTYTHRHTVTFQKGLYGSVEDIQRVIKHSLHDDSNFPNLEILLIPVVATQRVHIEVVNGNSDKLKLNFSAANSIGPLLGFTSDKSFAANSTTSQESDTTAALDRTTSVLIQTALCNGSVVSGKGGQSTVAVIHLADYQPASVVAYTPQQLLSVPAPSLAGATISSATFAIVNQNGEDLETMGEAWQLVLAVAW